MGLCKTDVIKFRKLTMILNNNPRIRELLKEKYIQYINNQHFPIRYVISFFIS